MTLIAELRSPGFIQYYITNSCTGYTITVTSMRDPMDKWWHTDIFCATKVALVMYWYDKKRVVSDVHHFS